MSECIFCRIVAGELPSHAVYEDDELLVFNDIHPVAPIHWLIIPKAHVESLAHCGPEHEALLGRMLLLGAKLAREHGLTDGFRTAIHTGRAGGQVVFHLHVHIVGGNESKTPIG
ncbi:MAG: histidine triad nucleotide-binding protein [Betaproteobacteria bacterium]|nr:histidine triad nucleotide-binding protein [Betaproteobacteria bacterium]